MPRTLLDRYMREAAAAMARNNRTLGERIREAREARGWKQKELAARVSVEPMTVSRWERGVNAPDIDTLRRVAQVTQQPLALFVEEPKRIESADVRLSQMEKRLAELPTIRESQAQMLGLLESLATSVDLLRQAVEAAIAAAPAGRSRQGSARRAS